MLNFHSSRLSWWWWCVCVWWVAGWAAKVFAVTAAVVSCHSCDVVFSAPLLMVHSTLGLLQWEKIRGGGGSKKYPVQQRGQ